MTREEAIEWIEDMTLYIRDGFNRYMYKKEKLKALDMAIEALKAEPVKHGEWGNGFCSLCGEEAITEWNETGGEVIYTNFCPNCGAKMTGGDG